jgi:hypothetical protein
METLNLAAAIRQSLELSDLFRTLLTTSAKVDVRGHIAIAYLSIGLEHREAILLLIGAGATTSAMALRRSLLEAFVSGAWVYDCATERDIRLIATMDRPPSSVERMFQQLRKSHDFGEAFETLRGHYGVLNDYAHGHMLQLSQWLDHKAVGPRYSEGHMIETLRHSDIVGLMAAIQRENIAGRSVGRLSKILEEAKLKRDYSTALRNDP